MLHISLIPSIELFYYTLGLLSLMISIIIDEYFLFILSLIAVYLSSPVLLISRTIHPRL
jgi:hypothetical protein